MQKVGRLELTWVGKYEEDRFEPRILIEDKEKSYGDASSDNMLIHGDNLLALKALERDYTGKIRCIYIDPPYNTGNAFEHYDDDLEHSIWLNMLYKRIRILHSLLAENGTLWISIDSTEGHYLKVMCDEIFGRSNFVSDITYEKSNVTGLGQGGAIFNTGEKILVYKKNILELNEVLASEKLSKKTMQRYRKYIQSEGTKELVEEFESASNGLPVRIYKHTDYVIGDISLKQFESRESEIRAQYYEFFDTIYRTYVVQQENEFQNSLMSRMEKNSLYSVEYTPSRGRNGGKETTLFYHNGELCAWLKDTAFLEGRDVVKTTKLSNVWKNDDIPKADLGNEGGVAFPRSKKPEKLIERILLMATNEGDLVLDSFLGSGTTAAVAHKMSRKYIGIELGDHCYSLCKKRLDRVIDGKDSNGVTKQYNWQGGGGYHFYELAPSLLVKNDKLPIYQINPSYTFEMLCEAICKIEGFRYKPQDVFHGHSSEKRYIHITTEFINAGYIKSLSARLAEGQSLLIYGTKIQSDMVLPDNIEVKKIPKDLLEKCDFESEVQ
ncbi:MAG TPA: site-specific DNA-methyltransferase [Candidatus Eisenbergiella merdigallinarum]|uniref:Site-specific DNA-methyltransferase n=1 Tax=Candidatus Eisenbergiella merdigallinarum TaxID=2838552 RepID=A0A9D2MQ55_9FIRM|nr:site-specific DNA-methyltransferase [Candidatus Eisenbergiella merdigallinarum]